MEPMPNEETLFAYGFYVTPHEYRIVKEALSRLELATHLSYKYWSEHLPSGCNEVANWRRSWIEAKEVYETFKLYENLVYRHHFEPEFGSEEENR